MNAKSNPKGGGASAPLLQIKQVAKVLSFRECDSWVRESREVKASCSMRMNIRFQPYILRKTTVVV